MPLFFFHGKYINEGTRATLTDGGTKREAAIRILIESVGGTCEAVYFGTSSDAYAIAKLYDTEAVTYCEFDVECDGTTGCERCSALDVCRI